MQIYIGNVCSVAKQFGVGAAISWVAVGSLPCCVCLAVVMCVPLTSHAIVILIVPIRDMCSFRTSTASAPVVSPTKLVSQIDFRGSSLELCSSEDMASFWCARFSFFCWLVTVFMFVMLYRLSKHIEPMQNVFDYSLHAISRLLFCIKRRWQSNIR